MTALLALLLLVRLDEDPAPPSACKPLTEVMTELGDVDVWTMPAEAIEPLLILHNASPPPSTDRFSAGAYATAKQGVGIVLWMRGSDVCTRDMIPPPAWARLRPIIAGTVA